MFKIFIFNILIKILRCLIVLIEDVDEKKSGINKL